MLGCFSSEKKTAVPIHLVMKSNYGEWLAKQNAITNSWLQSIQFKAEPGNACIVPNEQGGVSFAVCCIDAENDYWSVGNLPMLLPTATYILHAHANNDMEWAKIWGLGAYQFTRYKKAKKPFAKLYLADTKSNEEVQNIVASIYMVRDLINTPAEDMGPSQLAAVSKQLADEFGAQYTEIVGDALLHENYPLIHAVGRACDDAPRLIDIRFGDASLPLITLVGKGVCFDSGGLDIKNANGMILMKKDMGGAAHVLGLARMLMLNQLPISLRVLIPAVENSVSGNAYRPGDVIRSRNGMTVEVTNTDAEGRLVLADALSEAVRERPALLIDMATLTGAARVALGPELPAMFGNNNQVVNDVFKSSEITQDLVWPMPFFLPYRDYLISQAADIANCGSDPYGGAITAALFLKEFVPDEISWLHFDIMAWNLRARPGRPQGGEAMAIRTLYHYLKLKFASKANNN